MRFNKNSKFEKCKKTWCMLIIFFGKKPIYFSIFIYLAQNSDLSGEIKTEICIIKKSEISIATKL